MIRWFEHRQVYVPSRAPEGNPDTLHRPFVEAWFKTKDSVGLHGWFFPADAGSPRGHLIFLVLHGNAGNISHRLNFYRAWLELGINVFAFDYRGFGRSEGRPSEEGTYLDAQAAAAWVRERGFAPEHTIVLGKSLGGGIGSELVLREPAAALILQSTFTSIPDIGSDLYPWLPVRRWHSIKYDTLSKLPRIRIPILVTHSRSDDFIPFRHAERNFAAAAAPKLFREIAGSHNSVIEDDRANYLKGLDHFLRTHFAPR